MVPKLIGVFLLFFAAGMVEPAADGNRSAAAAQDESGGVARFEAAIQEYLQIRRRLKAELPMLATSADAGVIARTSDNLAAAIQRSRQNARRGDFFNAAIAQGITTRVHRVLDGVDPADFLEAINDEPTKTVVRVHMRYPVAASLATMPGTMLAVLPVLPPELEYRFVGRSLILRDRDAALILDYIDDVLPAR